MRLLRQVELFLDGTYSVSEGKRFLVGARCICNYVERALSAVDFESPYSRVNIICSREPNATRVTPYRHEPYLEVCILFEAQPLESLPVASIQQQFSTVILSGLKQANAFTPMPIETCARSLADFERGGLVNRWEHLNKSWSRWKCRCVIAVELTIEHFKADQLVYVDGSLIAEQRIAQTMPREGIFVDYLGQLTISSRGFLEYKRKGKVLSTFDLQRGVFFDPTTPTANG